MRRLQRDVTVAAGLLLVVLVGALLMPEPQTVEAAGAAPVVVQNSPLPVTLTGTGTISGGVAASQSGSWNVAVSSLPSVQLVPGTTIALETDPFVVELCSNNCGSGKSVTLPVGYRFVIEQVSGRCYTTTPTQSLLSPRIEAYMNGRPYHFYVSSQAHGDQQRVFNDRTRIYADGGVLDGLSFQGLGNELCVVTFSGELVPLPQ